VKEITLEIRSVFGTKKAYPICNDAKLFAALVGQTTLTKDNVKKIEALGYQIIYSQDNNDEGTALSQMHEITSKIKDLGYMITDEGLDFYFVRVRDETL